jgi:hypothetical protein
MPEDELWAAVQEHHDMILTAYRAFKDKKPIILLDIQEQRIYAYPYKEYKETLSPRSQASLTGHTRMRSPRTTLSFSSGTTSSGSSSHTRLRIDRRDRVLSSRRKKHQYARPNRISSGRS